MKITDSMIEWLASGERGLSSNTLFEVITGIKALQNGQCQSHPYDADDFRRCYLLVKQCPELREHLDKVGSFSLEWGVIVKNWDKLSELLEEELNNKSMKTNDFMKDLFKSIKEEVEIRNKANVMLNDCRFLQEAMFKAKDRFRISYQEARSFLRENSTDDLLDKQWKEFLKIEGEDI